MEAAWASSVARWMWDALILSISPSQIRRKSAQGFARVGGRPTYALGFGQNRDFSSRAERSTAPETIDFKRAAALSRTRQRTYNRMGTSDIFLKVLVQILRHFLVDLGR